MKEPKSYFFKEELILDSKKGLMTFAHITYADVAPIIARDGFVAGDGNMGIGVYCCDLNNRKSVQALIDFYEDLAEGEEYMSIIAGTYYGERLECVDSKNDYQAYNKGFVLLKEPEQIVISQVHTVPVTEIKETLEILETFELNIDKNLYEKELK